MQYKQPVRTVATIKAAYVASSRHPRGRIHRLPEKDNAVLYWRDGKVSGSYVVKACSHEVMSGPVVFGRVGQLGRMPEGRGLCKKCFPS